MGAICSKSANKPSEHFSQPGRVLGVSAAGNAEAAPPRASLPASTKAKAAWASSPGRTLADGQGGSEQDQADARMKAAQAAQKRAEDASASNKGKLGTKLAAQKAQTQSQALASASRDERAARALDDAAAARRWE